MDDICERCALRHECKKSEEEKEKCRDGWVGQIEDSWRK